MLHSIIPAQHCKNSQHITGTVTFASLVANTESEDDILIAPYEDKDTDSPALPLNEIILLQALSPEITP